MIKKLVRALGLSEWTRSRDLRKERKASSESEQNTVVTPAPKARKARRSGKNTRHGYNRAVRGVVRADGKWQGPFTLYLSSQLGINVRKISHKAATIAAQYDKERRVTA